MSDAAPSVGPTQGAHTTPSSNPTANWPESPAFENPPNLSSAQLPTGPAATANPARKRGTISIKPMPVIRMAATLRKTPPSIPTAYPIVATNKPTAANERANPPANAAGPYLCSDTAAPRTSGISGNTHGESDENTPARKAKPSVPNMVAN